MHNLVISRQEMDGRRRRLKGTGTKVGVELKFGLT